MSAPAAHGGVSPQYARALARERRSELRRRAWRIRRSVGAFALALFSAAFLAIYIQLASGHDPALASRRAASVSTQASKAAAQARTAEAAGGSASAAESTEAGSSGSAGSSSSSESTEAGSSGSSSAGESGASAVTTSQS